MLGFDFIEKCLFTVKKGQKSVFHPIESHIMSQLDILMMCANF
jgi:hypothetical protein